MMTVLLVGFGAAIGAILRYDATKIIKKKLPGVFPIATLMINLCGAFILVMFAGAFVSASSSYLLLGTGICGGFTTFSTMSYETVILLRQKKLGFAAIYLILSLGIGLLCVAGGYFITAK